MNKKVKFSIVLLSVLISSILIADLSKGVLISDQLEIKNGSYVDGKVFYSDGGVTDDLFSYARIQVEDIFTTTDTSDKLIQINVAHEMQPDYGNFYFAYLFNETKVEMTHLAFYDNRTTLLAFARVYVENGTDSLEITNLGYTKMSELLDVNNTKITVTNGTSYTLGSMTLAQYIYFGPYLSDYFGWQFFLVDEYQWTILGISPIANVGDTVNYNKIKGDVVGKPAVTSSLGKSFDTINVKYTGTSLIGWDDFIEVNAYYDIETGFLIKIVEEDIGVKFEFIPGEIKFSSGIPFSTTGIVLGLAVIGLIAYFIRKKK
jgi:hypothetical protein